MNETPEITINEEDESPENSRRTKWPVFIETRAVEFFLGYKLEKLSLEDGYGNKAKLSRTKEDEIKVEYSSITIL